MDDMSRITEKRNSRSKELDRLNSQEILKLINQEDRLVITAIEKELDIISKVVEQITLRMRGDGRLIYVGAGTSGRLGVLDAVECIPTFSIKEGVVVSILAGGKEAMFRAQENSEDFPATGAAEIDRYQINKQDTVIGIAASGNTPFVLGAIQRAAELEAMTVALTCVEHSPLEELADYAIKPIVGPEIITGSTRMKAGSAQKMVLNMISTTVMIKLGKVYSNLMVDLQANNNKLIDRACNIMMEITGIDRKLSLDYLNKADFRVKEAIVMCNKGCSSEQARELLEINNGFLRPIIE